MTGFCFFLKKYIYIYIYIYIYVCVCVCVCVLMYIWILHIYHPSAWAECDRKVNFQAKFNSFPSPRPVAIPRLKTSLLPNYLPISWKGEQLDHTFSEGISPLWNASALSPEFDFVLPYSFPTTVFITSRTPYVWMCVPVLVYEIFYLVFCTGLYNQE